MGRSSLVFAAMTLISRVLGLLRDVFLARYFDASITDPFFAALRIPNTLRRFFAEGGFANAFVPVFSATKAEHPDDLKDLLRHTAGTLLAILLLITLFGVLFSGTIIYTVANGLLEKQAQFVLAQQMLRIMFPYILLISLLKKISREKNNLRRKKFLERHAAKIRALYLKFDGVYPPSKIFNSEGENYEN